MSCLTTIDLASIDYESTDDRVEIRFIRERAGVRECVAKLLVDFTDVSFYAKQHLSKLPPLLECGVILLGDKVDKFLIPTGRSRMAGNGSIAVKYYDVAKPIKDEEIEKYERVGIRLPSGVFTYAFFEAQYLARAEDPRRGALFLIDPRMVVVQYPMTDDQKRDYQTFGGKKVLYFDVLDAPNLQERKEEIKRCRIRGDDKRRQYEVADKKWEEEMEARLAQKAEEESSKPKLSKKAKQKARQAEKKGCGKGAASTARSSVEEPRTERTEADAEEERLHKLRQAEKRAHAEEEQRLERELEARRKKLEAAEAKHEAEAEVARMNRVKSLLQKVQTSLRPGQEAGGLEGREEESGGVLREEAYESSDESSDNDEV
eukprot:CAMPEP_0180630018 /NCGR_PEP_ID=MMETSP1037_2-20121125/39768_1 /TAXON_ID=632150 /ORGANISM="Azadinium spinosum, Strain 3D9" /LENGTH=373 /DNA_ID=CAMNT_0022650853 /DNA_START=1 /DNA_END=1118 /DNA_ORIENTATION=+